MAILALALAGCTINGKTYGFGGSTPAAPTQSPTAPHSDRAVAGPGQAPKDTQLEDTSDPENVPVAQGTGELAALKFAPEPGIDTAKPQPPPWCATATKVPGTWSPAGIRRTIEAVTSEGLPNLLKGAALLCQQPKDANVAHATAQVLQVWMNNTGMSQAHAVESLTARLAVDRFAADQPSCAPRCPPAPPTRTSSSPTRAASSSAATATRCGWAAADTARPARTWSATSTRASPTRSRAWRT
jgi:hypothetical protein